MSDDYVPVRWFDLTKREAQAVSDAYQADRPARLAAAIEEFTGLGVPLELLDFSRPSLEVVWPAVVWAYRLPGAPEHLDPASVPYWAPYRRGIASDLGTALCWTVSNIAAYFAETVLRTPPGGRWVIGDVKNQEGYRQPQLEFAATGARMRVEDNLAVIVGRALRRADARDEAVARPDGLRRQFDMRSGLDPDLPVEQAQRSERPPADEPSDRSPLFEIENDRGTWYATYATDVDDELDHRMDLLVAELQRNAYVDRAWREDREVIMVEAPRLDAANVLQLLTVTWSQTGSPRPA